jgi:type IV secretion system protein TrbI
VSCASLAKCWLASRASPGSPSWGALIWALDSSRRGPQPPQELFNTANKATPDGLAALPKDYRGIPQLGPPLPGDLGRPMLNPHSAVLPDSRFDTAEQRLAQESEAARTSQLFSTTSSRERPENGPALSGTAAMRHRLRLS